MDNNGQTKDTISFRIKPPVKIHVKGYGVFVSSKNNTNPAGVYAIGEWEEGDEGYRPTKEGTNTMIFFPWHKIQHIEYQIKEQESVSDDDEEDEEEDVKPQRKGKVFTNKARG